MRMMLNRRDNGEDGKTENTQGRPDSSYSLQEVPIFPQPMVSERISIDLTGRSSYRLNRNDNLLLKGHCSLDTKMIILETTLVNGEHVPIHLVQSSIAVL